MARSQQPKAENRRVHNATPTSFDGIDFKSKLEVMIYRTLKEQGFYPVYEGARYTIIEGYKPLVPFYTRDRKTRLLKLDSKKVMDSTYTPDFTFEHNGYTVIVEAKGIVQDAYVIKRKLFRKYLEANVPKSVYFEVYTKRQLLQAIDIINQLE